MLAFASCGEKKKKSYDQAAMSGITTRTENLRENIKAYAHKGTLIGQMYGSLSGIGWNRWQCDSDRCDMKDICGHRPAATGYELQGIESGKELNADGVPFKSIRKDALKMFGWGGLLVMNWTAPDYQGKDELLEEYAHQLAKFLDSLQDGYGIKAPVVLNLLPLDGNAWYCKLSKDEYVDLYKKMQELLGDEKVSNVIYGYSETYSPHGSGSFLVRYPDHDIDVIQLTYQQPHTATDQPLYHSTLKSLLAKALPFAQEHNAALGLATGIESIGDSSIYSETLLPALKQHPIAYLLFGRNQGEPSDGHYYVPYPGTENQKTHGFMTLANDKISVFLEQLNGLYLEH